MLAACQHPEGKRPWQPLGIGSSFLGEHGGMTMVSESTVA